MPQISQEKKDKISEQILNYLFSLSPEAKFTSDIAKETARDEEFIKVLLQNLKIKKLVIEINKNSSGTTYIRRQRWRLSNEAHNVFSKHQSRDNNTYNSQILE
jgi:predicted transcriptional regulator with HTH domain